MDSTAFKTWLLPLVTHVLGVLGKYILPPIMALTGLQQAEANNWWTATAGIVGAMIVAGVTSWLTKKSIITKAAAQTDAKIDLYDKT